MGGNGQTAKQSRPQRRKGARAGGSVLLAMWFLKNSHGPWGFLEPKSWLPERITLASVLSLNILQESMPSSRQLPNAVQVEVTARGSQC